MPHSFSKRFQILGLAWAVGAAVPASGKEPVRFNEDIRPILSNSCFHCHGPDEEERKAGLRLDTLAGATEDLGGYAAVVPGKPEESLLLDRVNAHDPDEIMPPTKSGEGLPEADRILLRRWIEEGAGYATHWAYVPPERPEVPASEGVSWGHQDLDQFVLRRLQEENLKPSPEADRHMLARRVALDLTGLPPRDPLLKDYLASDQPGAYEAYVDALLAEESFGEHWARHWLDLSRYADSAGYADDPPRTIWAFRDYVIRSFNANMPFDQFTREQLAGDLLPDATQEQLIATAFHRNTQTNNEGGTNDEEFRTVAVVDRVNTTFAVWMGTTMACAQCHTHKYDPITHKEYFEAYAILNNTADADRRDESPTIGVETETSKSAREAKRSKLEAAEQVLVKPTQKTREAYRAWQEEALTREVDWLPLRPKHMVAASGRELELANDGTVVAADHQARTERYELTAELPTDRPVTAVRLEVEPEGKNLVLSEFELTNTSASVPPVEGRYVRVELEGQGKMIQLAEVQVFSGGENVAPQGKARQSSTYADAEAVRAIDGNTAGDYNRGSVSHTGTNDRDPFWEVDLGETHPISQLALWNRTDGRVGSRLDGFKFSVLDQDRTEVWSKVFRKAPKVDLQVPLDGSRAISLQEASASFSQDRFSVEQAIDGKIDGRSGWALAPRVGETQAAVFRLSQASSASQWTLQLHQLYPGHPLRRFRVLVTADPNPGMELPSSLKAILQKPETEREKREERRLFEHFASSSPSLENQRAKVAKLREDLEKLKPETTVPILRELPEDKRRKTHIQLRGSYLSLGDEVGPGLPEHLFPEANDSKTSPSRLDLANWLMDPRNPMTARVTANRFWEAIFGIGLVRTSEEFGSQGEPPSHPELLDWLALELVDSGWDVKAFLKMLVTSAAYRQSSKVTPALLERDPDNRLLARGPRFRLSAEMVRDQALFVSGLLSEKMYGPPVKPRQPNIGLNAAFGGGIDWKTSSGEDQYRRGLYTTWRRSNPYPSMAAFDAPNREVCTVRRDRTNTPLQALVTLNDPVYMEAAQALARWMARLDLSPEETVSKAVERCLVRPATDEERVALVNLFAAAKADLKAEPERAQALATEPLGPAPDGADVNVLAAWSVVGNVLLNVDEIFLKP